MGFRDKKLQRIAIGEVNKAVKRGDLIRLPCEYVGCTIIKTQAHHYNGYGKEFWLDVIWLCPVHHGYEHRLKYLNIRNELIVDLYNKGILPEFQAIIFNLDINTIKSIIKKQNK